MKIIPPLLIFAIYTEANFKIKYAYSAVTA